MKYFPWTRVVPAETDLGSNHQGKVTPTEMAYQIGPKEELEGVS